MALVVVLALAANAGWRWWHNRPPFGPEALSLQSSLELVGYTQSQTALGRPVGYAPSLEPKVQMVLGRVSWRPPPEPLDGFLMVVLIDKRSNRLPSISLRHDWPRDAYPAGVGGGGPQNKIAERYPWLRGMGDKKIGETEWLSEGSVVWANDQEASPLTFVAHFPPVRDPRLPAVTGPIAMSDLLLAVVYIGSDNQIYWAHRLEG